MIDDEQYSSFKFNGDEEPETAQTIYQEEAKDRRVEKLGYRVTIISILIPVLIAVVLYMGYRDITSRVSRSQDTGEMEIQNLSSQLEENFNKLSAKYGELENALNQKLADLEKVDKAMKTNLKQAQEAVANINATKADKKEQLETIAKIDSALNPIREELKALKSTTSELQTQNSDLKQQLEGLTANLTALSANTDKNLKGLTAIQTDLSALSEQKMNKDDLQLELLKARKNFQRDLDSTKAGLEKKMESILKKIGDLEKIAQAPQNAPKSTRQTISPGSGGIVEQDIKE